MYDKIKECLAKENYMDPKKLPYALDILENLRWNFCDGVLDDYDYANEKLKKIFNEIVDRIASLQPDYKVQDRIYEAKFRWSIIKFKPSYCGKCMYQEMYFRRP